MQIDDLQQYIRYSISQLSALNGQAEFEKVCLYFGRYRIHRNILPATGPVQAGGDQGRDFETFHTYLTKKGTQGSYFLAEYSDKPVAFACSLEKNPTKKNGKIISDVKTITGGGVNVDKVYFFSGQDIPVAMRHKVQAEVKKNYHVELEVFDAQALAQHLCDADLFWVATQFLKVPSEFYPERKEDNWYVRLLKEYRERKKPITTFEEFEDVKSAIRFIYKKDDLKSDLTFWLPKLDEVISQQKLTDQLVRKAIYEKFVASLIGLDYVEGQEENIKGYFAHFENFLASSELEDAQHLLSFCQNSRALKRHNLPKEFLDDVTDRMEALLNSLIENAPTVDNKCMLLETRANFYFHDRRGELDFESNINRYVAGLDELLEILDQTHFFPIGRLSDLLNEVITILIELPIDLTDIEEIAADVDDILSSKAGAAIAGQKLKDRAVVYLQAGDNTKAIKLLHEVKLKWFNHDTVKGSVLTCLLLAQTYQKQELYFSAKYYAFIAAYLAWKTKDTALADKVVQGISIAADCDYATGSWLSYMRLLSILFGTHAIITKDFNLFESEDSVHLLYYPAVILEAAANFLPEGLSVLEQALEDCGPLKTEIDEVRIELQSKLDSNSMFQKIDEELKGIPFNDLGPDRSILFNACGCDWHITFKNDRSANALVEGFIAIFQIILQEVSDEDLHLKPGRARIHIVISKTDKGNIEEVTIDDKAAILISLPRYTGTNPSDRSKYTFDQIVYAQGLLYQQSMLPFEAYEQIIGKRLKDESIIHKTTFGQAYELLYLEFTSDVIIDMSEIIGARNPFYTDKKVLSENKALPWKNGISPRYNETEAMQAISNRIEHLQISLAVSLPLLKELTWFRDKINAFRAEGWLDWQLLHVLGHIVVNYKAKFQQKDQPISEEEARKLFFDVFQKDEKDWYVPIDNSIITDDRIKQELEMMLPVVTLRSFGLENRSQIPDTPGILKMLKERFRFFEDGKDVKLFD